MQKIRLTKRILHASGNQPQAKFGFEAMHLAAFFGAVGSAMFGDDWSGVEVPMQKLPSTARLNDANTRCLQVVEQLSLAFASGEITAAVQLSLPPYVRRIISEDLDDDDLDIDDEDDVKDVSPFRHYPLTSAAWDDNWPAEVTNWSSSELRVSIRHITVSDDKPHRLRSRRSRPLQEVRKDLAYVSDQTFTAPVVVLRADMALRALLPLTILPEKVFNTRYDSFKNRLVDEVVAAAWRAVVLNQPSRDDLRAALFIKYMHDYMIAQGIDGDVNGLSDKLLEAIATKLMKQVQERNLGSRVLLNSTPVRRTKGISGD